MFAMQWVKFPRSSGHGTFAWIKIVINRFICKAFGKEKAGMGEARLVIHHGYCGKVQQSKQEPRSCPSISERKEG
jgi:hypothetical protein